jgi:hypothetical protein
MRHVLLALLVALVPLAPQAQPKPAPPCKGAECDRTTPWKKLTQVSMIASEPDSPALEIYRAEFDPERRDFAIQVDLRRVDGEARGTVAMVGGRVMLARGLPLETGRELEAIDLPLTNIQLAQVLLGRAIPGGPDSLRGERNIDHRGKEPIVYGTAGAQGRVEAPWRVTGKVSKVQTGSIHFNLVLEAPLAGAKKKGEKLRMQLQGELSMLGRAVFTDDAQLDGWTVYTIAPREQKRGDRTVVTFSANAEPAGKFATIGDVRAFAAKR